MKRSQLLIFVLLLIAVYSCANHKNEPKTPEEVIKNAPVCSPDTISTFLWNLLTEQRIQKNVAETAFLGYEFDMSREEVEKHTKELLSENKIGLNGSDYYYNFIIDRAYLRGILSFDYSHSKDSLHNIKIMINDIPGDPQITEQKLLKKFVRKYITEKKDKTRGVYYKHLLSRNDTMYTHNVLYGNMEISIMRSFDSILIVYYNWAGLTEKPHPGITKEAEEQQLDDL